MSSNRKAPEMINRLDRKLMRQLEDYVQAEYAKSGLSDAAFAKQAEEHMRIPLTHANIAGARETFGIKSNREVMRELNKTAKVKVSGDMSTWMSAVEARLTILENRYNVYIDGCRKHIPEGK